jgi:transposase
MTAHKGTAERRTLYASAYLSGKSVAEVATEFGVSEITVYSHLSSSGIRLRRQAGKKKKERNAEVLRMLKTKSMRTVAKLFGISPARVNEIKRNYLPTA